MSNVVELSEGEALSSTTLNDICTIEQQQAQAPRSLGEAQDASDIGAYVWRAILNRKKRPRQMSMTEAAVAYLCP